MDKKTNDQSIVQNVIERCHTDSAFRAALKQADNPDTEYRCWEYLADYNVVLDKPYRRLPFTTVFAAAARSGIKTDGFARLGYALRISYDNDTESAPARAKLRRLLACTSLEELCSVLRPLLKLIAGKSNVISYSLLLNDLTRFHFNSEQIKAEWAQSFFGKSEVKEESL